MTVVTGPDKMRTEQIRRYPVFVTSGKSDVVEPLHLVNSRTSRPSLLEGSLGSGSFPVGLSTTNTKLLRVTCDVVATG